MTTIYTAYLRGVHGHVATVDAAPVAGLPGIEFVGADVPDAWARETRVRMASALDATKHLLPSRMAITVTAMDSGAPLVYDASLDAAIFAVLRGAEHGAYLGEISLDGKTRPVRGIIARCKALWALLPRVGITIPPDTPKEVLACLDGPVRWDLSSVTLDDLRRDVVSEATVQRARAAVRDRKTVLLVGPPGAGKTMLARRLVAEMPIPSAAEQLEIAQIHDAAGLTPSCTRPFRAPHHTASQAAIFGGGGKYVRPGELSLAHGGILFFDEATEFRSRLIVEALDTARRGAVVVKDAVMPAAALIIAAANLCACGYHGGTSRVCRCSDNVRVAYRRRLDTLRERFDVTIEMGAAS